MSIIASNLLQGDEGYNLTKSLRFRQSAGANLSKTFASAGNQKTWTMSMWVKRGKLGYSHDIMGCYSASNDSGNFEVRFQQPNNDAFYVVLWNYVAYTNAVFRDPSAWYHIVLVLDTTQAGTSSGSKIKVYVNGVLQSWNTDQISSSISQNANLAWNGSAAQYFGRWYTGDAGGYYYDGYLTEVNFIDGQALTPSSFGETDVLTGVWKPKKYAGTYGTNGFYLPFTDVATTSGSNAGLGKDFSGNGNYWNTNNISVTAGSTYDSMKDVPTLTDADTANYAVLNPLNQYSSSSLSNANLRFTSSAAAFQSVASTISVSSGKWYWEVNAGTTSANGTTIGISDISTNYINNNTYIGQLATSYSYYSTTGQKINNNTGASYGATWTSNDVIGVALDLDAGTLAFYKNGASQGTAYTGLSGNFCPAVSVYDSGRYIDANFGQRPFSYTPPTGFKALNTFNLPDASIVQGNKHFDALLYTGNGSTQTISGLNFQPDLVWGKNRSSGANSHNLFDVIRGATNGLASDSTSAEFTRSGVTAFNSNGFSVGSNGDMNGSSQAIVAWAWKANGSAVSNTAGSITSQVSANPTAGFSVVTYTGTGSNATVGHGLGVAPKWVIVKGRNVGSTNWFIYTETQGATKYLDFSTGTGGTDSSSWNNTAPTSSVFSVGNSYYTNYSSITYVAYCFSEVAGYSKFGSYAGNGSNDGTFVYTGFRPKFILRKVISGATNQWVIFDTSRDTYNQSFKSLYPNVANAEETLYNFCDILSNGFKMRNTDNSVNGSGCSYIYMAFAESPFKNSLAR